MEITKASQVQRGTAIVPTVSATEAGFPNVVNSIGSNRTPTTMNLDLGAYYPIKFGEKRELRLIWRLVQRLQQSAGHNSGSNLHD